VRFFALVALLWASTASAGLEVYSNHVVKYSQFNEMDKTRGIFALDDSTPLTGNPTMAAAIASYLLHKDFVYTSDGIGDNWDSNLPAVLAGEAWAGDCDDFSFTAAEALVVGGIPRSDVFIITVTTWLRALENGAYHRNHPRAATADHMAVLFWAGGKWRVIANEFQGVRLADEVFGGDLPSYYPQGIINLSNYGVGKANHTGAGFVRFWYTP
jgi:hypothetical protein